MHGVQRLETTATSAMGTNRGRGQGDRPRRRRLLDRIRFGAASLTVVFELPLSDVTVVDGEKVVLECHVAVKPAAEVTGTSTRRSRCAVCAPAPGRRENGASQPLTLDHSFVQKTLYDKPPAPRGPLEVSDVTRSSVTLSWLAPTSNGGATTNSASASKTSRSARPTAIRAFSRPTADGHGDNWDSTCPSAQSLFDMPAVTFSFRHRTFSESKPVTFTSLLSCRHAYNVKNTYI